MKISRRTHFSQCERSALPVSEEILTEQSHAAKLDINHMVKHGFLHNTNEPIYGDFTEVPELDTLVLNRRRLNNLYASLPNRVKKHIHNIDELVRVIGRQDESELIEVGLLKPSEAYKLAQAQQLMDELGIKPESQESDADSE